VARRSDLLAALGLFDDAAELAAQRYPSSPLASALTRALLFHEAGVTRRSIQMVEGLMTAVPDDYRPPLLPPLLRRLLYPRDYYPIILEDAREHRADPRLVLAIMREESRFDPRARSVSSARGLLQFIIGTARQVGRRLGLVEVSPEDLYEPRIVIRLGAKHVGDLTADFGGNPYRVAAAYNAGPAQARLWARMAAGTGDDAYLTAINFDETKRYVGKVMNSYERYGEIYGGAAGLAEVPGVPRTPRAGNTGEAE
jgi:soluble lytic murein transglycosylase